MSQQDNTIKITIPEEQLWENLRISNDFMFAGSDTIQIIYATEDIEMQIDTAGTATGYPDRSH